MTKPLKEPHYEVVRYTIDNLKNLFVTSSEAHSSTINGKLHTLYFEEYFRTIGAKTIIVENNYIDHDFLEDYAGYYVRCFCEYRSRCTRLHFFNHDFYDEHFKDFLSGSINTLNGKDPQDVYLGFIVVKPLPQSIIGRTCLKTYEEEGHRKFPATKEYQANLFGISLKIEHTLAFQEQDRVVAACATSALWSVFQRTGEIFQHHIPSPVEITKKAGLPYGIVSRSFPNAGLTPHQIANAIHSVDLEPYFVSQYPDSPGNEVALKGNLFAYLRGGIPVLMVSRLFDTTKNEFIEGDSHGIAITGYSLDVAKPLLLSSKDLNLMSTKMDKIYAHDDQVGPFARMTFEKLSINTGNKLLIFKNKMKIDSLSTSWLDNNGQIGNIKAVSQHLIIPLYHKIRIPFSTIMTRVGHFNQFIEILRARGSLNIPDPLIWQIHLSSNRDLKISIFKESPLASNERIKFLTFELPRFVWRATAFSGTAPILDFVFDTTDIEQGDIFIMAMEYDYDLSRILHKVSSEIAQDELNMEWFVSRSILKIFEWFAQPKSSMN